MFWHCCRLLSQRIDTSASLSLAIPRLKAVSAKCKMQNLEKPKKRFVRKPCKNTRFLTLRRGANPQRPSSSDLDGMDTIQEAGCCLSVHARPNAKSPRTKPWRFSHTRIQTVAAETLSTKGQTPQFPKPKPRAQSSFPGRQEASPGAHITACNCMHNPLPRNLKCKTLGPNS